MLQPIAAMQPMDKMDTPKTFQLIAQPVCVLANTENVQVIQAIHQWNVGDTDSQGIMRQAVQTRTNLSVSRVFAGAKK